MTRRRPIRVLVVDDSATMRRILGEGLARDPELEVVGCASDPYEARDLIVELTPDVLTLDVEMPRMDGLAFLRRLMPQHPLPVVMVSGVTPRGGAAALAALAAGAIDVVSKPSASRANDIERMLVELRTKLRIAASANVSHWKRAALPVPSRTGVPRRPRASAFVIAIGASTGGTEATLRVLAGLPADTPAVVVVQHMPAGFTSMYADRLNREITMRCVEAGDGQSLVHGTVYVAPGDKHCAVVRDGLGYALRVRPGPKVGGHCPSVDVMFGSVALAAARASVGVLLTGMGRDGASGLLELRRAGARTIVQDEASCVVYGMPKAAVELGAAEEQLPVDAIADAILARIPLVDACA